MKLRRRKNKMEIKVVIELGKSFETLAHDIIKSLRDSQTLAAVNCGSLAKTETPKKQQKEEEPKVELKEAKTDDIVDYTFLRNEIKSLAATKQDEGFDVRAVIKKYAVKIKDVEDKDLVSLRDDLGALK